MTFQRESRARAAGLLLGVQGLACSAERASDSPAPLAPLPHVASEACPLKTPADWQTFLELAADDETWVRTCSDLEDCGTLAAFTSHVERDLLGTFELCADDLRQNPPIALCTERLRRFAPAWLAQHSTDSYGFVPSNRDYFALQTLPGVPSGMMDPPAALVAALPERADIEATARENGWPYLVHDSCLGGVRIFIVVDDPDDRFEQWMLLGLDAALRSVGETAIFSFIAVQKRDGAGALLPRTRLHFRDYVASRPAGRWQLELPETMSGKCYACHGSGLRELVPFSGTIVASAPVRGEPNFGSADIPTDFGLRRLAEFNERISAYGPPDWGGTLIPEDHGPPLGAPLGCTTCHDGEVRGVLTVSTSEGMLGQKVVTQLAMRAHAPGIAVPDTEAMTLLEREQTGNPPLSEAEQALLSQARAEHLSDYEALVASRFPDLRAWLLENPCE